MDALIEQQAKSLAKAFKAEGWKTQAKKSGLGLKLADTTVRIYFDPELLQWRTCPQVVGVPRLIREVVGNGGQA